MEIKFLENTSLIEKPKENLIFNQGSLAVNFKFSTLENGETYTLDYDFVELPECANEEFPRINKVKEYFFEDNKDISLIKLHFYHKSEYLKFFLRKYTFISECNPEIKVKFKNKPELILKKNKTFKIEISENEVIMFLILQHKDLN